MGENKAKSRNYERIEILYKGKILIYYEIAKYINEYFLSNSIFLLALVIA